MSVAICHICAKFAAFNQSKLHVFMKQFVLQLFWLLLFAQCTLLAYSNDEKPVPVRLNGTWVETDKSSVARSLPPIPITAYTDGSAVYISNNVPDGDIDVSVVDGYGTVVINHTFSEIE